MFANFANLSLGFSRKKMQTDTPDQAKGTCRVKPSSVVDNGDWLTIQSEEKTIEIFGFTITISVPQAVKLDPKYQAYIDLPFNPEPTRWIFDGDRLTSASSGEECIKLDTIICAEGEQTSGHWQYGIQSDWVIPWHLGDWSDIEKWSVEYTCDEVDCVCYDD